MQTNITNLELEFFLEDFRENSETIILEEGSKERDEIIAIAKAKGIILKNSRSLAGFKNIYTLADKVNKNGAILPRQKLLKALPTLVGKPIDVDHLRKYVIGFYIDYRFKERENLVVAYGILFKDNFKNEWDKVKALFKAKKLNTSYEIFCPKNKYKYLDDGSYELTEMEIAGGAILFREDPAFDETKVLELARHSIDEQPADLVYASIDKTYKCSDIIIAENEGKMNPCSNCGRCEKAQDNKVEIEIKKTDDKPKEPINNVPPVPAKIKCSNCQEELIAPISDTIKCPKCFAILDKAGQMLHPPQIIDFRISCPSCSSNNWRLLSKAEDTAKIQCLSCSKQYEAKFSTKSNTDVLNKFSFAYFSSVSCHQCGKTLSVAMTSNLKNKIITCNRCGLTFNYDIAKQDKYKQIKEINELVLNTSKVNNIEKSSEGGQVDMKIQLEVSKFHRYTEDPDTFEKSMWTIDTIEEGKDVEAKKIKYQERKALPDSMFAMVLRVKNKKTGKIKKIRMYPIQDEAHVTEALARLEQEKPKATLKKLGVNIEKVGAKILRRVKQLKMAEKPTDNLDVSAFPKEVQNLVKKFVKAGDKVTVAVKKAWKEYKKAHPEKASEDKSKESEIPADMEYEATFEKKLETSAIEKSDDKNRETLRKAVRKIIDLKKQTNLENASINDKEKTLKIAIRKAVRKLIDLKKSSQKEVAFYKENAKAIYERREELGVEFASELSDTDILDDDKFGRVKAEKENVELRLGLETSSAKGTVGSKLELSNDNYYASRRKKVDEETNRLLNPKKE